MPTSYCHTEWTRDQLDNKLVEFKFLSQEGTIIYGKGQFRVRRNSEGLLDVVLKTVQVGEMFRYESLSHGAVNQIKRHANPAIADFMLIAWKEKESSGK